VLEFNLTGLIAQVAANALEGMRIGLTTNRKEAAGMREGRDSTDALSQRLNSALIGPALCTRKDYNSSQFSCFLQRSNFAICPAVLTMRSALISA
jgi:hypothetical protein